MTLLNKHKIILGTANFDQKYGILSKNKKIKKEEIDKIFEFIYQKKITKLDTAYEYGNIHRLIGNYSNKNLKIYTKFPKILSKKNIQKKTYQIIEKIFMDLKVLKLEAMYFHHPEQILSKEGEIIYSVINELKKNKMIKKIGFSIYNPYEMIELKKNFDFDIIQAPLNIFDQRMIKKQWLEFTKNYNIQVVYRSIFLQGILLNKIENLPKHFKQYRKILLVYQKWIEKNQINNIYACISFIMKNLDKNEFILGFRSRYELDQLFDTFKNIMKIDKKINFDKKLSCNEINLIDPRKWL